MLYGVGGGIKKENVYRGKYDRVLMFLYDYFCKIDFWNIKVVLDYKSCVVLFFCRKKVVKIF